MLRRIVRRRASRGLTAIMLALVCTGCSGSSSGPGDGPDTAEVGIELSYAGGPSPRAEGLARTLAASSPASAGVLEPPSNTWLRLTVSGPGFEPIVCEFPRASGGACAGVPAGSGRVVTVEEWDSAFGVLYYRGIAPGVAVRPGRTTRVRVSMRPPVVVQEPVADGALNRPAFTAIVQSEPYATITLYLGTEPLGTLTADEQGVAKLLVDRGGPGVPLRTDGKPGLPDGEYLLTAVAFPRATPGGTPVRYQGVPHAFVVDLVGPSLNLSAPSVTNQSSVPLAGVTEPGARVRCGLEAPDEDAAVDVDPAGRFALSFPLAGTSARIVCSARDRAGNQTTQEFIVAHLPDGFAVEADLPDVTRVASQTMRVTTDATVEDLEVDIVGEVAQATRGLIVPRQTEPGAFEVSLPLFENQWNRVLVSARIRGRVLGAVEKAVEHDDVAPKPPVLISLLLPPLVTESSWSEFSGDKVYVSFATFVMQAPEPGGRVELFHVPIGNLPAGRTVDGGVFFSPPLTELFSVTATGIYAVRPGECFRMVYGRTVDRAGNESLGWGLAALGFMNAFDLCVR